jgi:hypothetical protein
MLEDDDAEGNLSQNDPHRSYEIREVVRIP